MNKVTIKIKRLHPDAKIPIYATKEAGGFDFYSIADFTIPAGKVVKIPMGLSMEIPEGYCLQMLSRSGLMSKGIYQMVGIIDSDYRGEIHFIMFNTTEKDFKIEKGDRIAQGIIMPVFKTTFKEVKELSKTERGSGGFQSTGKK